MKESFQLIMRYLGLLQTLDLNFRIRKQRFSRLEGEVL
jgi:hypothetical protein